MSSIPTSPVSPKHRRQSSSQSYGQNPLRSPRSSVSSRPMSPETPRQRNSQVLNGLRRMSSDYVVPTESTGGLGNLADELADAWADEEGYESLSTTHSRVGSMAGQESIIEQTAGVHTPQGSLSPEKGSLGPPKQRTGRHSRQESNYDGSDYGHDSDFDDPGDISPALEARMAGIESLVRRGTEENGSSNDQVIKRVIESLRDLGGQSGIENGATRLITAHASITSHLTHQTRALQTLIHPLLFSPFPLLSPEAIDSLVPLIDDGLLQNLPLPFPHGQHHTQSLSAASGQDASHNPLLSLQTLITQTSDLTLTLRTLSDTLHESRQLTSTASRRLRSARELVAEIRREDEDREEGTMWIEKGEWDRKLKDREAGRLCREVVGGFEAVCGEWRRKLFGTANGTELAAA